MALLEALKGQRSKVTQPLIPPQKNDDALPAVLTKEKAAELVEGGRLDDIYENYVFPDYSDEEERWPLMKMGGYARQAVSLKKRSHLCSLAKTRTTAQ